MSVEKQMSLPFRAGLRRLTAMSLLVLGGALGGSAYWALTAQISAAVIAPGQVVPEGNVKFIQHSEGGYISEILVANGDEVQAGQTVIRLDPTRVSAAHAAITEQLNAAIATEIRLVAESIDKGTYHVMESDLSHAEPGDAFDFQLRAQELLLASRRDGISGQLRQFEEQKNQISQSIIGLKAEQQAARVEQQILAGENEKQQKLFADGLVTASQVATLGRQQAQIDGRVAALASRISQANLSLAEIDLQVIQLQSDFRRNALEQLAVVRAEKAQLIQNKITLEDQMRRLHVRTTQAGIVHDLQVFSVDGVIRPGETLMSIVPKNDALVVEAKLSPRDIDQVHLGQPATLTFTSFNMRTTPQIEASVLRVSPDISVDDASGQSYYRARFEIPAEQLDRLGGNKIVPGMPVDAFLRTGERNVAAYLWQPITDHLNRAFREE